MADIRKIVELYEIYGSYKRVGRELNISHNTVRKYIQRVNDVKSGTLPEILPHPHERVSRSMVSMCGYTSGISSLITFQTFRESMLK